MLDVDRMKRQLLLLQALAVAEGELREAGELPNLPRQISMEAFAMLVIAARVEEFCDTWGENIHRAGEGI